MKVLLSIKPEFATKIFSGEKKYEYRKVLFRNSDVETILVYSTLPVGKIIGEFRIRRILKDSPSNLWSLTHKFSGISKEYFLQYFEKKKHGYAIEIESVVKYREPIDPSTYFNKRFIAPQSFMYVSG